MYAHPDLDVTTVKSDELDRSLSLIGYFIDPEQPGKTNEELLVELLQHSNTIEQATDWIKGLSGRFVLMIQNGDDAVVLNDACGLRTVFYTEYEEKIYIGSQPTIIEQLIPLKKGKSYREYLSAEHSFQGQDWLPSGCSLYEGVHHLVPNHYLSLSSLDQTRFWPTKPIFKKNLNEAASEVSSMLKHSISGSCQRQTLALSLTAGWDSRILLSASKECHKDIYYYTQLLFGMNKNTDDIKIPTTLSELLGLKYEVIDCRRDPPEGFEKIYLKNTYLSHTEGLYGWYNRIGGLLEDYPEHRLRISGNCTEIARCSYYRSGIHPEINSSSQLTDLVRGWSKTNFIKEEVENWYQKSGKVFEENGLNILDMFYWEHKMGSWQAQHQLEWDVIHESFTPFNNRKIIETMLGVDIELRIRPECTFFEEIITNLWPETLQLPVNPPPSSIDKFKDTLVQSVKNSLSGTKPYKVLSDFYHDMQKVS
ncbi:hypothetical protein [Rhodohalobacter sp. 8-1]|uniref:hypothetical protein n=1 Tax=Rhodohalobacter sp. 8-1 TaxID=3131972 RepID=UPI0030ED9A22